MQASKTDSRIFASYPMPAKIDLLNERPRRESLVEQQLGDRIGQIIPGIPQITVNEQVTTTTTTRQSAPMTGQQQQQQQQRPSHVTVSDYNYCDQTGNKSCSPTGRSEVKETRIVINRHSSPISSSSPTGPSRAYQEQVVNSSNVTQEQQRHQNYQAIQQRPKEENFSRASQQMTETTVTTHNNKALLTNELAEKEAKLMREINALNQRPYSPYQSPSKIDLVCEKRIVSQQNQYSTSPRPHSSASSAGADLLEKEAKLMKEIEEIESKPFNPRTMVVERENWYEYPAGHPDDRHLTESRRRVRDFCSTPSGLYQERHIHEENLPLRKEPLPTPSSIHTTIIRSPKREIDNKSPLPFAFDNFTTKGVRGNIATVGAVEPERPRPPIFPIVKRTPSPAMRNYAPSN